MLKIKLPFYPNPCEFEVRGAKYRLIIFHALETNRKYFILETDDDAIIAKAVDIEADLDEVEVDFDLTKNLINVHQGRYGTEIHIS